MMNWATLYSVRRTGDAVDKTYAADSTRHAFQQDYDRIIFSSAFRRLQNKTQVFPLPGAVFVHNRLTHSLEVASVGRSLGKRVGEAIAAKYGNEGDGFKEFYKYELAYAIAAACLAHDIGNPPFGHSGEDAIRTYFTELEGEMRHLIHNALSANQLRDLEYFEGNANALRTLTHSFGEPEPGGYKLTYTTLAALAKYPCSSAAGFNKQGIATKKSGFFDVEAATYAGIAQTLGVPQPDASVQAYARHPFVYLTEAADDICYRVIDLEDAHRLHIVALEKLEVLFFPFFEKESGYKGLDYLRQKYNRITDPNQKVQYLRARWIGLMIEKLSDAFMANEEALLAGTLNKDLLKCLTEPEQELIAKINVYSKKHVYNHKPVVEIELAGYNVIGGLLKEFVRAVLYPAHSRSGKIIQLIPAQFPVSLERKDLYKDVQSVVDYISGMTDLYAIDLYRKLTGINIPEIR